MQFPSANSATSETFHTLIQYFLEHFFDTLTSTFIIHTIIVFFFLIFRISKSIWWCFSAIALGITYGRSNGTTEAISGLIAKELGEEIQRNCRMNFRNGCLWNYEGKCQKNLRRSCWTKICKSDQINSPKENIVGNYKGLKIRRHRVLTNQ